MATETAARRRHVVLHFDLNRTVLMSDAAGGRSMENTVDYLLSECTWGFVDPQDATKWVCVSEASSLTPPVAPVEAQGRPLISYKQFVDDAHPYKSLATAGSEEGSSIETIKAFNKAAKKKRTALQSAFTGGDGPGARVRASFEDVMHKLHFPEGPAREAAQQLAASLPASRLQEAWLEGRYYLLPSFLDFLTFVAGKKKEDVDVQLVFRTFGDDIPEVAAELELFVDGKHPLALGKTLPASFKLDAAPGSRQTGTFYRDGFDSNGSVLAAGTLTKVPFSTANQQDPFAPHDFYATLPDAPAVEINRGFPDIQAKINKMLVEGSRTIALRDYWEWWSAHAEAGEYGKLLLVEATSGASDELAVFFDDHIEAHHAHIVDVRDVATGAPVPFESSKGKFLQRVEPFAAITDPSYFISLFDKIVAA